MYHSIDTCVSDDVVCQTFHSHAYFLFFYPSCSSFVKLGRQLQRISKKHYQEFDLKPQLVIGKLIEPLDEVKWWQAGVEFVNWTLFGHRWNLTAMHQVFDEKFQIKWQITIFENTHNRRGLFILWILPYFTGREILDLLWALNQIQETLKMCYEFLSNPSNMKFCFGLKRSPPGDEARDDVWIKEWYLKAL